MRESRTLSPPTLVVFGLYALAGFGGPLVSRRFWTARASMTSPPWYFIGQDLILGLLFLVALAASLLIAVAVRRRYPAGSHLAAFMALLWMGYPAARGLVVLARTDSIWDPARASSQWQTFDQYFADPARWIAMAVAFGLALLFHAKSRRFFAAGDAKGPDPAMPTAPS
jgi:hypothetical protein